MRPNSPFLAELNHDLAPLAAIRFTSIWTPFDFMIVPAGNSELPVGRMVKISSPAHGVMLYDRRIWRAVVAALTDD
jgi:triacylglycerol lipase